MKLFVIFALMSVVYCQILPERQQVKRSYVCPPKFVRQGHRCYFFSKEAVTWQEALFSCRDMHSNIAIIKTAFQDKLIRNFLSMKSLAPLERWLGGVYDWGQMKWMWAASGKALNYHGFSTVKETDAESLRWHCIIMDPSLNYRWSSRSCVEKKHFICHTKLKTVGSKGKKKLQRQYHADKYNKLNEIPVPIIQEYTNNTSLKFNPPITYKFEINKSLNDQAMFAFTPAEQRRKVKKNRKRQSKRPRFVTLTNGTVIDNRKIKSKKSRRRKNKTNENDVGQPTSIKNIKWKTYTKKGNFSNPLYPNMIVEEFNYVQE